MYFSPAFVTLLLFAVGINATGDKHLYRAGNASSAVGGKVREQDFGAPKDGQYHPHPEEGKHQGLSTFADPKHLPGQPKHVYAITPKKVEDAGFHVHDDQKKNTHHTIALKQPHDADKLHGDLKNMGWEKMSHQGALDHHGQHRSKRSLSGEHDARPMNRVRMVHEAVQASKRETLETLN
ncbi:hypothetical protein FRC14_000526 [Serendipita sp. 396]|nr:hypothetical protein FRC14_000526 [Serendipita sp. 396]KAG8795447.1 hypothetical protein FRC16_010089 [Serendipita sp. 398]KAG8825415.1 hypothetical protein FRC19_011471 [Serendipita sp. 401]KAG9054449.1 hypothetical protein FS842_005107 [Serendipita sp. 407]